MNSVFLSIILIGVPRHVFLSRCIAKKGSAHAQHGDSIFSLLHFMALRSAVFILIRELPERYGLDYGPAGRWIVMLILSIWVLRYGCLYISALILAVP